MSLQRANTSVSGLTMRVADVGEDTLAMAIEGPPGLAAPFQPVYSIISGAVYVVSVRPSLPHGIGQGEIGGQVWSWTREVGVHPNMRFGSPGAHPLLPALAPPGPGVTASEPHITIFPVGPPAADGVPVAPGQVVRHPRYVIELEVGNRGPTETRRHLHRYSGLA